MIKVKDDDVFLSVTQAYSDDKLILGSAVGWKRSEVRVDCDIYQLKFVTHGYAY